MYGAIPDVVISKPPRNNQLRVVVALGVGVMIGALGTAMLFPQSTKETESPTPAPRPILAASTLSPTNDDDVIPHNLALMARGPEAPSPSRAAMELDQTPNAYLTPGQYHECHLMVDKALNDQYDKMSKDCKSEWG